MNQDVDIKAIIGKANKLFALAEKNSNPNESANAFFQAQKLLEKYKLTRAELDVVSDVIDEEPIVEDNVPLEQVGRSTRWKDFLSATICRVNGCHSYWSHKYDQKHLKIIGRPSDVTIVRWLYRSVTEQIETLCKAAMLAGLGRGKHWANSFKQGASSTVTKRLREAQVEVRDEYKGTAALVLVKKRDEDLELWVKKHHPYLTTGKSTSFSISRDAYSQGIEAGRRVDLTRGKLGTSARGLLGN